MERASNKAYVSKRVLDKYKKEKERISEQKIGGGGLGSIQEEAQMEDLASGIFDSGVFKGAKVDVKNSAKTALEQEEDAEDSDDSCLSMNSDELNDNLDDDFSMEPKTLGSIQQQ